MPDRTITFAPSGIRRRMVKGAAWMVTLRLTIRAIGLAGTIILARLLAPDDFGLIALATSFVALLEALSEFSFDIALIRNQSADRRHYDTAWTLTIIRGTLVGSSLAVAAAPIAGWFQEPRLVEVLYVLAALAILSSFENIGTVDFRKELRFEQEFMLTVTSRLAAFIVTVLLAFWLHNYWALLAGIAASRVLRFALSYILHPFRPRLSLAMWRDLMGFSKWMVLTGILGFLVNRVDTFILGKISGVQATGIYQVAYEISNLPATELVAPISRATYPAFSKLVEDRPALQRAFLESLGVILAISLPAVTGIALTAELVVTVFLGPKWNEATNIIQILAFYGAIRVCFANAYSVFLALNRPDIGTWLSVPTLIILVPLLIWWTPTYGAVGAAWSLVSAGAVTLLLNTYFALHLLQLPTAKLLSFMWRPIIGCLVMLSIIISFHDQFFAVQIIWNPFIQLIMMGAIGATIYILTTLVLWKLANSPHGVETILASALLLHGRALLQRFARAH